MQSIVNANIVFEDCVVSNGLIIVEAGKILYAGEYKEEPSKECTDIVDAEGMFVGPGFVDIHVHGAVGSFIYDNPEKTSRHFLEHGHTSIFPALYDDLDCGDMIKAAQTLKNARSSGTYSKIIEGLYMEGPYMNSKYGAEVESKKWNPSEIKYDDYSHLVEVLGNFPKVWVIAPERDGIENFVKHVKTVNPDAVISVGHSEATPAQIRKLKKYGLILQTHCMDATGRVGEGGGIRRCGPDEECFLDDNMYAELICDSLGIHVDPDMLSLVYKVKGRDRIILITDSTPGEGVVSDVYPEASDLNFDSLGRISGSKLTLDAACRNMVRYTGCTMSDAFIMASTNPAKIMGIDNQVGTISVGKRANLVFIDNDFNVKKVMLDGKFTEELKCRN